LQQAEIPLHFEVCAANRSPSEAEWSLLRAPWELLADERGFLARDVTLGFSPARRLGRSVEAPPLDKHRLGLVFMAASPQGGVELDYEAEETAIISAVGSTKIDLLVEESGNPKELGERLTEYAAMQALHISCHGHSAWRPHDKSKEKARPVLLLESLEGEELPTDAGELISALRGHRPRLVFLSACLTAAAAGEKRGSLPGEKDASAGIRGGVVAHSLAEALVSAGLSAVLGWDGSVRDSAATAFAATLYDGLEGRLDLGAAVAAARRDLLNAAEESKRRDWHLARLWLGPQGGGPIVGGSVRRQMVSATHGHTEFLDKKQRVPVALHEMFVGRRRELQKALQALRDGEHSGVLLHGMGRLGKSSLAARIANRRRDLRLAVVFEHYGARDVLAALEDALRDSPKARDLLRNGIDLVRGNPERLEDVLIDLLRGPSGQMEEGGTPVLLVIDDLEQVLEADPKGGRHRVKPGNAPVLRAVLRAFEATINAGVSRLIITSRYPFALDVLEKGLFELQLPPLSEPAQRKLELRQKEAAADAGLTGKAFDERKVMLERVPGIARGNPGLQDLIGRKFILSAAVKVERAKQTLDEMEAWLKQGDLPSDAEVKGFLENLAVDALLELAGDAGRAFLRKLTLFDLPVPQSVAEKLAAKATPNNYRCDFDGRLGLMV
jgi:CHAT domain-containing protein